MEKVPILVDMSTNSPEESRQMNQRLMEFGSCALDAPVSGGECAVVILHAVYY